MSDDTPAETIIQTPVEGGIYVDRLGRRWRFERVPSGATVFDAESGERRPHYHTLRTWYSHSTDIGDGRIVEGPCWDSRFGLGDLTDEESLRRYGHVFSLGEISMPRTMPDDILYFRLVPAV